MGVILSIAEDARVPEGEIFWLREFRRRVCFLKRVYIEDGCGTLKMVVVL